TENKIWRVLFALAYWDLLFEPGSAQANEFDRLPLQLQQGEFYAQNADAIEASLAKLEDKHAFKRQCTRLLVKHHGYPTGLFRWNTNLMDTLIPLLDHANPTALASVLRKMAQDYLNCKDGYPDIMVVDKGQLRFEEIKAPGDVLRANQLVCVERLRRAGLEVLIRPVEWRTNPQQVYSVVDIETTGGRNRGNAITEIAVVKVKAGEIIDEWSTLVQPERRIPKHITHLTGISNEMVVDAPLFHEIGDELLSLLEGSIFVAHNVGFDYGFIKAAYDSMNRSFKLPKMCTVRSARKAFPGLPSYSLGNLTEYFDIDLKNHHRALSDARATAHLLRLIQAQTSQNLSAT
ncbi:MAG: exonuclease domain-containing protein, partial [Pseudomonadota bacterium]